jgi:hypothetical protein
LESALLDQHMAARLGLLLGIFPLMALWGGVAPRRALSACKALCWFNHPSLGGKITGYTLRRRHWSKGEEPRP